MNFTSEMIFDLYLILKSALKISSLIRPRGVIWVNVRVPEQERSYSCLSKAHSSFGCVEDVGKDCFSIICNGSSIFDLKVKEAFFISSLKPSLNSKYESMKQISDFDFVFSFLALKYYKLDMIG